MRRKPVDLSATFFAEIHSMLSVRERKRRSDEAATTMGCAFGTGDVSCEASVTVRRGDSSSARAPECWAEAQDGKKARTNNDSRFIDSRFGFVVTITMEDNRAAPQRRGAARSKH